MGEGAEASQGCEAHAGREEDSAGQIDRKDREGKEGRPLMPGAPKGMRWQTAVEMVQAGVEAHIARRQAEADRGSEFLSFLQRMEPPAKATRVIGITHITRIKGINRSGKPQPGSIPDRVLEI